MYFLDVIDFKNIDISTKIKILEPLNWHLNKLSPHCYWKAQLQQCNIQSFAFG